jgi:hypothetical protein
MQSRASDLFILSSSYQAPLEYADLEYSHDAQCPESRFARYKMLHRRLISPLYTSGQDSPVSSASYAILSDKTALNPACETISGVLNTAKAACQDDVIRSGYVIAYCIGHRMWAYSCSHTGAVTITHHRLHDRLRMDHHVDLLRRRSNRGASITSSLC